MGGREQHNGRISSGNTAPPPNQGGVNIQPVNITRKKIRLILLFWVKERDSSSLRYTGNAWFSETVQTRLKNIKNADWYDESKHKIHCPPIQAIHEIGTIVQNWIDKYGGKEYAEVLEIGVCSHCGVDGPISYQSDVTPPQSDEWPHQMAIEGGWDAIDFNWVSSGAMCVFYGCNSGTAAVNGFAVRLSKLNNFKNVDVWGQTTASYPSFYPDYRVTTVARAASLPYSWDVGPTYMVGGNRGDGKKAISAKFVSSSELNDYPKANPMGCYKLGINTQTTHQGVFNDHRK